MTKTTTIFMCNNCGNEFTKWAGKCPACGEWNTMTEVTSLSRPTRSKNSKSSILNSKSLTPAEALKSETSHTFTSTIGELDRVLGPGFTQGGVYLIAGQPGIGKSTLLTQLAISLSSPRHPDPPPGGEGSLKSDSSAPPQNDDVLYVCSEENPAQVATRITRITKSDTSHIKLLNSSSVDQIISQILNSKSSILNLVIVDSIQSVYLEGNPASAGSLTQVRDSANSLIQIAKETN